MDDMSNFKAFAMVAQYGSFTKAAVALDITPSVLTKRINQLEWKVKTKLFYRNTRTVQLTPEGERYLNRIRSLITMFDETVSGMMEKTESLMGTIRIKAPTTISILYLNEMLIKFQQLHPNITLDVVLLDRTANPIEEGFDIAISAFPSTFSGVVDVPLCEFKRMVCASPNYLAKHEPLVHPQELLFHDIICYKPTGTVWSFDGQEGPISISVLPRFIANEGIALREAAVAGHGIVLISTYIVEQQILSGELEMVLPDFVVPSMWLKAVAPSKVYESPLVQSLIEWLKLCFNKYSIFHSS